MDGKSNHQCLRLRHKVLRAVRVFLIAIVFAFGGSQAIAKTTVDIDYYEIYASDAREVFSQIASKGSNGFAAHTDWAISYQYTTSQRSGNCRLVSNDISLSIEYLLPKWKNEVFADLALQSRWKDWYKNLVAHEEQHGAHGEAAYESISRQFDQLDSEPSCEDLSAELASIVSITLAEYADIDDEYDRLTQHGTTEGAAQINLLDEKDRVPAIAAAMEAKDMAPLKKILLVLGGLMLLFWAKRKLLG